MVIAAAVAIFVWRPWRFSSKRDWRFARTRCRLHDRVTEGAEWPRHRRGSVAEWWRVESGSCSPLFENSASLRGVAATSDTARQLGACIRIAHDSPAGRHVVDFERDALGREARRRSVTSERTELEMVRAYDAMDRLLEQQVAVPQPGGAAPKVLSSRRWHYDRNGRPTAIEDARWGTTHYRYDPLGQLLEAKRGPHQEVFDYDVTGSLRNILTEMGGSRVPWHLEPGNVLIEKNGTRYENDSQKRRTRKIEQREDGTQAITAYRWDVRDRLREVRLPDGRRAVYRYDAFARRVTKELHPATTLEADLGRALTGGGGPLPPETTRFLYDGDVLCAELRSPDHGGVRVHVHEAGSFAPLLQVEQGQVFTVVNDHLGMPKELVDGRGRVAWAATHSAWGRIIEEQRGPGGLAVASPFRLLGQYADDETELCYVRFRYFDPGAGRWCSPDPLTLAGGINLQAYGRAPTSRVDPLGLLCKGKVAKIPEGPGVYHVEANGKVYTGSAANLRDRMTRADHPARALLDDPNAKITIRTVDLGDAKTDRQRNHVLRYFEQQEMDARGNKAQRQAEKEGVSTNSLNIPRAAKETRMDEYKIEIDDLGASRSDNTTTI